MDTYKLNMICRKLNHLSNGLRSIRNLKENFCKKAKKNIYFRSFLLLAGGKEWL